MGRERVPLKPDDSRNDGTRTLVADDGQWPAIKGLSDRFKDLEEADADDDDGSSPFQTIVPQDD